LALQLVLEKDDREAPTLAGCVDGDRDLIQLAKWLEKRTQITGGHLVIQVPDINFEHRHDKPSIDGVPTNSTQHSDKSRNDDAHHRGIQRADALSAGNKSPSLMPPDAQGKNKESPDDVTRQGS
jgi:hypothetical protein